MHSYNSDKTSFHFNNDFSGDIIIIDKETNKEVSVNAEDILKLVAYEYILPKKISELEQLDYKNILNNIE